MKYRIFALFGLLAMAAGSLAQAQDYDDIYYDASKDTATKVKIKAEKPVKTTALYGNVPDQYKVAAQSNYRVERDEDEYNRRGVFAPDYEVDINGDTIYFDSDSTYDDEAFANTRRIERFYNPDIVILSDDDELVELYYDESPTINLVVGSDWGYASYGWASTYYPWYTGWYDPWYTGWYDPWYWHHRWYSPYYYGYYWRPGFYWGWTYSPWWHYGSGWWYGHDYWAHSGGWNSGIRPHHDGNTRPGSVRPSGNWNTGRRTGLASNRNTRSRVGLGTSRNSATASGAGSSRSAGVRSGSGSSRSGYATSRGAGNMRSRTSTGVTTRSSSPRSSSYSGGSRSSGSYSGSSRSSGSSYSSGSRSSGSSYSSGSHSSGGSYSSGGGSRSGGGGGGSHGGSSGGGGHRR